MVLTASANTYKSALTNRCVVALGGADSVSLTGAGSAALGGDGDDSLAAPGLMRGGKGNDCLRSSASSSLGATILGNEGNDSVTGSTGPDRIVPGAGVDTVEAGAGNDVVTLCEINSGERLNGSTGTDELRTLVPLADLRARGVTVTSFEKITVTQDSCPSNCDPATIDDGNPCTLDRCNIVTGTAEHIPVANGTVCSDGNACTAGEVCTAGACGGGVPVSVDDGNACTADSCNTVTGAVSHTPVANGTACSDGNACTAGDACAAGACVAGTPVVVDDGNVCTADSCNTATGSISHSPVVNGTACSDGNACTLGDACTAGACAPGTPALVDDGNTCTADGCDTVTGAVSHAPVANGTVCSDGNACTAGDACAAGACAAGTPVVVDDGNVCTADSCDSGTGSIGHTPVADGTPCYDGNACTSDACSAGVCEGTVPGDEGACDDGNTNDGDSCVDCTEAYCGDGNIWLDECEGDECEACDDGNEDSSDACIIAEGYQCVSATCGDGFVWTTGCGDNCEQCDDGNSDDNDGCTNNCVLVECGDGQVGAGEECDDGAENSDSGACTTDCRLAICGDSQIWSADCGTDCEECDDGVNAVEGACPSCHVPYCGDGNVWTTDCGENCEQCDDANSDNFDGCTTACELVTCGDGEVDEGEECDNGAANSDTGACTTDCHLAACGDGKLWSDGCDGDCEECDDGNTNEGDACARCKPATCGDGFVWGGVEECDELPNDDGDGALPGGDLCSSACTYCTQANFVKDPTTGSCYYRTLADHPWSEAQGICDGLATGDFGLASLTSDAEIDFLLAFYNNPAASAWTGGNDLEVEGTFTWKNGEPWGDAPWAPGQPSGGIGESCVRLQRDGLFNDWPCTERRVGMCERVPRSCAEIHERSHDALPGSYVIDADGFGGAPAASQECSWDPWP